MSNIAFQPNASGTGTFTITSPATSTNRTLTLPDASGTAAYIDTSGNFNWGIQGNGRLYSDVNWGCIFQADRVSPAQAEFMWMNAGATERMRISNTGNVGIGSSTSNARVRILKDNPSAYDNAQLELVSQAGHVMIGFHAEGNTAVNLRHVRTSNAIQVVNFNATAFAIIEASAFSVNSDYRLKENITPLKGAADRIMQLPVHNFSFVEGSMSYNDGKIVDGFLAHEVQTIVPEAVIGEKDAVDSDGNPVYQGIDQSKLVPLLTAALQEALEKISTLETRVSQLEGTPA